MNERIKRLNKKDNNQDGTHVLYVMSRDQRVQDNHALLAAQEAALEQELPLVVVFNLLSKTGHRSREHYEFMLSGLEFVSKDLQDKNIPFCMMAGNQYENIRDWCKKQNPSEVFFDFNSLSGPRNVQKKLAKNIDVRMSVVDTHNIIPVWAASDKEEFAAHTFRPKIHKKLQEWLTVPGSIKEHPHTFAGKHQSLSFDDALDHVVAESSGIEVEFKPGEKPARDHLDCFIKNNLTSYAADRNNPTIDGLSGLSPYLHYGQISSLRVAHEIVDAMTSEPMLFRQAKMPSYDGDPTLNDSANVLLEEMIVRKELSDNFCLFSSDYTSTSAAKDWAKDTISAHESDVREYVYSKQDFEDAKTHDTAWNAAQTQLTKTGKMHGYMRMYWAKKILEWTKNSQQAIDIAIYLNDTYSIDGGDPNGYVGILWSIVGIHDRAWTERDVFGKVRYMNYGGLKRKFDIASYEKDWLSPEQLEIG